MEATAPEYDFSKMKAMGSPDFVLGFTAGAILTTLQTSTNDEVEWIVPIEISALVQEMADEFHWDATWNPISSYQDQVFFKKSTWKPPYESPAAWNELDVVESPKRPGLYIVR